MSRRHQLQVNTFPFLAVLLCAMGSLILVLLVMDRRSKKVAQARAQEQLRRQDQDHALAKSRRRDEFEAKKRSRDAAWEKKRDALRARVGTEEKALSAELREVQERLAKTAERLKHEETTARQLRDQIKDEQGRVARQEELLQTARTEASTLADKAASADKARAKLADELVQLENYLAELKKSRQRDEQTFSVVPYRGKRGDNRRPLYIECGEGGFVLHPDQMKLDLPSEETLRAELTRRIARQKDELAAAGEKDARPYLMLLVRPEGVRRFYELQAAARQLQVDFGYEFVNADWKFHIPENTPPSRSVSSEKRSSPTPPATSPAVRLVSPGAGGGQAQPATPSAPGEAGGNSATAGAAGPAVGEATATGGPGAPNIGLTRPVPYGSELPPILGASPGKAPTADAPIVGAPLPPRRNAPPADTGIPTPSLLPPVVPSAAPRGGAQSANTGARETSQGPELPAASAQPGAKTPGSPGGSNQGGPRPLPLRPAQISGVREVVIYVECQAEGVIVYPTRTQVTVDHLTHSAMHNKLYQTVRQLIARQMAQPGGTQAKVQVRFLIHRDAERTFHRAYPVLEGLPVPKAQVNLMPDDDVARIVAGY